VTLRTALVAIAAALLVPAALDAQAAAPKPVDLTPRTKGDAKAPVTVYEMSDFQCPFCRRFAVQTFPELERDYIATGKVRWVFIHFPLTQIHDNAAAAAELATCAGRQGKFWEVHDLLFRNQAQWSPLKEPGAFFLSFADSAAIPKAALQKCLQSGAAREEVEQDAQSSIRSGATSTPAFYIEGGILEGAQPTAVFRQILDSILTAKAARKP
jgi:protein-disulfide isomerase